MFIQNVSRADIEKAFHYDPGVNSMLIQIIDVDSYFPKPLYKFKVVHQFKFDDAEDKSDGIVITDKQATEISRLLQNAFDNHMNVIVHCHAGICRSGAVAEVGIMLGFQDTDTPRIPNLLVKKKLIDCLGLGYHNIK